MAGRMGLAYRIIGRTFGAQLKPLVAGAGFMALRGVVAAGMAADRVLFPALGKTRVQRPIVIVGNPRTGTTLLHRFLCEHGYGVGQEAWRMAYPSLTLQTLLGPLVPYLERVSPTRHYTSAAHETGPTHIETDDASILLRYFDGFFLYGFLMAFHEDDLRAGFLPEVRDTSARDFAWLDEVWRRSLVAHHGAVVVAKLFSLGARMPAFQKAFPDARVLYMARDPVSVLPSALSLVTGVLDSIGGFWSLPEAVRARWIERLYGVLVDLLRRFWLDWESGAIDRSRVMIVRYDHLMRDFEGVMAGVHDFLGVAPTAAQEAAIKAQAQSQRSHRSGHRYALERFGLSEARVREDTRFFSEAFLP